jgi:hypothetical protein
MPTSTTTNAGTVQFREIACISRSVNRSPRSDFQCEHLFLRCLADMILTIGDHPSLTPRPVGARCKGTGLLSSSYLLAGAVFPARLAASGADEFGLNLLDAKTVYRILVWNELEIEAA